MQKSDGPIGTIGSSVGRFWIWLTCRKCGHGSRHDPWDLANTYGFDTPMRELVARAKCEQCGARECGVLISPPAMKDGADALPRHG